MQRCFAISEAASDRCDYAIKLGVSSGNDGQRLHGPDQRCENRDVEHVIVLSFLKNLVIIFFD
jgi:hypothetical protein